jgi:hypothetical protein
VLDLRIGGWKTRACTAKILIIVLLFSFALPSEGRIGYDIKATTNSAKWEIHRSTQELTFSLNGSTTGTGNFSKYIRTQNFGGINSAESSYSLSGSLYYKEMTLLKTLEGPVSVKTKLVDIEIETPNETKIDLSTGDIEIQEQWPTYYANLKQIRYLGPGIRTKEVYENNGDIITNSLNSWKLNKESLFKAYTNKTVILVNLTPSRVYEERFSNKSSTYILNLETTGDHASLGVVKKKYFTTERFGRPETESQIYQDYVGDLNTTLKLKVDESIILNPPDDSWLPCCSGGYFDMIESDRRHLGADEIFNCSCRAGFNQAKSNNQGGVTVVPSPPIQRLAYIGLPVPSVEMLPVTDIH